jgi:hypothetical protein
MRWNTLKVAITDFVAENNTEGTHEIKHQAQERGMTVQEYLGTIDIRNVDKLRDLLPDAFPKTYRRGRINVYMDDRGWHITKQRLH